MTATDDRPVVVRWSDAAGLRSLVVDRNGEHCADDGERAALMAAAAFGVPQRRIHVRLEDSGHVLVCVVHDGVCHDGGFWEADAPVVRRVPCRDSRVGAPDKQAVRMFGGVDIDVLVRRELGS